MGVTLSNQWYDNVTPSFGTWIANFERKTTVGRQFGWGGTLLKQYQECPKVGSGGSETTEVIVFVAVYPPRSASAEASLTGLRT